MEKIWLKKYPKGVNSEISTGSYSSVVDVLTESAQRFGSLTSFSNMGASLTFTELDRLSDQFASFLQNHTNLKAGDRIAIQMPNLLQFPIALFGAMKAGLIIVNTNPLYTPREMKHQFKDSGAKAIVILANFASHLEEILKETQIETVILTEIGDLLPIPKRWIVNAVVKHVKKMVPAFHLPQSISFNSALAKGAEKPRKPHKGKIDDIAFLQYTGGTTGVAKGAVLTHRNVLSNMQQIVEWMKPLLKEGQEIVITALPLYHIFSMTVNCLAFFRYGGHNVLVTNPRDIPGFIKILRTTPFTVMTGVNTLYNALMNHPDFGTINFSKVKVSVAGAMALQKAVAVRWLELTKTPVVEGYGLTETSPVASCNPIDGTDKVGTIGLPLPSTEIKLIDDDGKEVKMGEAGEICIHGPQVMQGYWMRKDETDQVLTSEGWLKTGDVGVMDPDGFVKIVDRKKDMILVSGFNVYPNEVEDVVAHHPKVLEVAAIGVPDKNSGEVVKIVVVKKDDSLSAEELLGYCRANLTGYKIPKHVEFRTELPKTNVGKILRRALRDSNNSKAGAEASA